jgi:hypothetical protein
MTTGERYDYSYIVVGSTQVKKLVTLLNDLSAEGWQLVTTDDIDPTIGVNSLPAMIRRPIEPLPLPADQGEGWYPDPAGRYDKRYWNGRAWTFHVARVADESTHRDPRTVRTPTPDLDQ